MSRYLTPAKISLLALIELYTDAVVPTLSSIPILAFLIAQLHPASSSPTSSHDGNDGKGIVCSLSDLETLLRARPAAGGLPGRTLWDLFLAKLWGINSLDGLHVFFTRLVNLLAKTRAEIEQDAVLGIPPPSPDMILLSRMSPLGAFVRRAQLEFVRLRFHDTVSLWRSFVTYRQVSLPTWRRRNAEAGSWCFDVVLGEGDDEWGDDALETFTTVAYGHVLRQSEGISDGRLEGAEGHIFQEGSEADVRGQPEEEEGHHGRQPAEESYLLRQPAETEGLVSTDDVEKLLEFQVEQMQRIGSRVPDEIQNEFRGILSSNVVMPSISHYVSFLNAWRAGDYPTSFDSLHRFFDYTMQNRDRTFYQYALLNLAVLQADFGCLREAATAMQETVSVARENKDMSCLNFSLSWLYHFGRAHPKVINAGDRTNMLGVERDGLVFLRTKAKESGMWSLWNSALLSEAKAGLSNGESIATAFENILRSSQLSITKNMMYSLGPQMLLQSSLWSRLGITHLAWSYCEVFLRCHSQRAPFDDILRFRCRVAYLLAMSGRYDKAMEQLEGLDANALRTLRAQQYWLLFRGILRLKRDLHRNHLDGADLLLRQLLQARGTDPDLAFELHRLHIDTLTRRGAYTQALARLESLAATLQVTPGADLYARTTLLVLKAQLLARCGRPQKGFSIAMRAAALAWRSRLLVTLWPALGTLAHILTSLDAFDAAARLLTAVLPRALEAEDAALAAQLFSSLVDAHMGLAGQAEVEAETKVGSSSRNEHLMSALGFLDRALSEYTSVEDVVGQCEMWAKKATIMRLVGEVGLANDYAAAYLAVKGDAAAAMQLE